MKNEGSSPLITCRARPVISYKPRVYVIHFDINLPSGEKLKDFRIQTKFWGRVSLIRDDVDPHVLGSFCEAYVRFVGIHCMSIENLIIEHLKDESDFHSEVTITICSV